VQGFGASCGPEAPRPDADRLGFHEQVLRDTSTGATIYTDTSYLPALADLKLNRGTLSPAFDPDALAQMCRSSTAWLTAASLNACS